GAVEAVGNFASIEAKTETGTVITDVPAEELTYQFLWTESRPRYLADFDIADVKEKKAGMFEVKGRRSGEVKSKKNKGKKEEPVAEFEDPALKPDDPKVKKSEISKAVSLNFTTARGIILLNVPPNEVMSDLRERPLTEAAKAIVRSGDSLLMEAIRRASPKYFGDYARTLPPLRREPTFTAKSSQAENLTAQVKTALVRVTDIRNRAIDGLEAKDFEVTENGTAREIVSVTRSTAPFNLVLLLDVSGSVENYVNFIRKAARNFVDTVGRDDRISIVIFNEDVKKLSDFTTNKDLLSKSLDTFDAGGGTAYYDALAYTIADTLRPLKGERTAIVILTDGDDNRSFLAFDSLMGSIQESGALIYPLYVPSGLIALAAQNPNIDIDPMRKKYMSLTAKSEGEGDKLAKVSGGVYYPITQIGQIQKAYEDIVLQMRSAYNVTFRSDTSMTGANGASPHLKIKPKRENVYATVTSVVAASEK
ncbi:MAG: VWA domain-containing protein, partial [Acidobacteriota bacterium]